MSFLFFFCYRLSQPPNLTPSANHLSHWRGVAQKRRKVSSFIRKEVEIFFKVFCRDYQLFQFWVQPLMDRITNLPENVVDHILERLPFIDRVRTSTLSKSWKLRWTHLSSLPLNEKFFRSLKNFSWGRSLEYATIVNSILHQHDGFIQEFSLHIPYFSRSQISLFEDTLRSVTMNSGIKTLYLDAGCYTADMTDFPPFFLSIFCMVNLRHLGIISFHFRPPSWFEGYANLKSLQLTLGSETTVDVITHFISLCPQLEIVELYSVWFGHQEFELKVPKLRSFTICGIFKDIYVSSSPNLESVEMWLSPPFNQEASISVDMFKHFKSLAQVEQISISGHTCKPLGRSTIIRTHLGFNRMKALYFRFMNLLDADQLHCVLSVLASSPNLRELRLYMSFGYISSTVDAPELEWMVEKYICDHFRHLRKVTVGGIWGTKVEMKIIERLFRFSPVLEEMVIFFNARDVKMQQFLRTVKNLYRTSTKVKFVAS